MPQPLEIERLISFADLGGFYFPLRVEERESKMLREVWDIFVLWFFGELKSVSIRTSSEALERYKVFFCIWLCLVWCLLGFASGCALFNH